MSRKSLLSQVIDTPAPAPAEPAPLSAAAAPVERPQSPQPSARQSVRPSRANKAAKTFFLPPEYWQTLEELSFRTRDERGKRTPQERMVAEALNMLFHKYNYPQVRE